MDRTITLGATAWHQLYVLAATQDQGYLDLATESIIFERFKTRQEADEREQQAYREMLAKNFETN